MKIVDHYLKVIPTPQVTVLSHEEQTLIQQAVGHLGKKDIKNASEQKIYEETFIFEQEEDDNKIEITQINKYIKYDENFRVNIVKSVSSEQSNSSIVVRATELKQENGKKMIKTVAFQDGVFLTEGEQPTNEKTLKLPEFENDAQPTNSDVVALDLDDCIIDGCCSFRYNGLPWNPLVKYNWCGANCGSGNTVNPLDACCKTHDICYATNTSYPGRCYCDGTLMACALGTDEAGSSRVYNAFLAKMMANNCPTP